MDKIPSIIIEGGGGGLGKVSVWQLLPKSHPQEDTG